MTGQTYSSATLEASERASERDRVEQKRRGKKAPLSRESYRGGEPFLSVVVISRLSTTVNREK